MNAWLSSDDDELDYPIDYRDQEAPTSRRNFVANVVQSSGQEKFVRQARFSRRSGGAAKLQNGIHRRANQRAPR